MSNRAFAAGRLGLVLCLSFVLAACSGSGATSARKLSPGTTQHASLSVNGHVRTYRLFQPRSLDPKQAPPLVVVLHPCMPGGNGDGQAAFTHFDDTSDTGRFIAVYPDGIGGCWNFDRRPDMPDDVAFIGRLLDRLATDLPIDGTRIFIAGISGGANMAYRLACELSNRVTAIASVSGTMTFDSCHPARPVSILEMHGTEDFYEGGALCNTPSVTAVTLRWKSLAGCPGNPSQSQKGITRTSVWKPCKGGTVVRLETVVGGHHTWFGSPFDPVPGEPNANAVIWDFFRGSGRSQT